MAVLSSSELVCIRQNVSKDSTASVSWIKSQINLAAQAIEDEYETNCRAAFGTAIETAVPGVFSNQEKKLIGKWWFSHKFSIGG